MKKILFLNILSISLLFFIIFLFLSNSINTQAYLNPGIGYGYRSYDGYPGYGYTGSPYSAYPYAYPYIGDGNYSKYVLLGGDLVPREVFELLASSDWDTAQLGHALLRPYFQPAVISGWTPWVSPYSNPQTFYKYGGYPPVSPNWPPIGMSYDPYNGYFYIPGQYRVGYPRSYYGNYSLQTDNTKEISLPHSMKGYELYSWQIENDWYFTLITGTNRLKSYEEITSDEDIIEDGWVKITVGDLDSIKTILCQLPKSEEVFWIDDEWFKQVQGETGGFIFPDTGIVDDIKIYCQQLGIELHVKS